jgi:hypothetical protein
MASHTFEQVFQRILDRHRDGKSPYGTSLEKFLQTLQAANREMTITEMAQAMGWAYDRAASTFQRARQKKLIQVRYVRVRGKGNYNQVRMRAKSVSPTTEKTHVF